MGIFAALLLHIAAGPFGDAPAVPDAVLANERGGIRLPNGVDVTLSVDTRTAINGSVVLQTIARIDQGAPVVTVYAPEDGQQVALDMPAGSSGSASGPVVRYDRQNGVVITASGLPRSSVLGAQQAGDSGQPLAGLRAVAPNASVQTANGVVSSMVANGLSSAELRGLDFQVQHLAGRAFGSIIANSANDRTIDTVTTISIDLRNAGVDVVGSTMFRVENLGIEALSTRL